MTEEHDETATDDAAAGQSVQLQNGDILRFPLIEIGGKGSSLSMRCEVEIATGADAERLGLQQAKVFQEIQTYLVSRQSHPGQKLKDIRHRSKASPDVDRMLP